MPRHWLYFNPRSPHGERQKRNDLVARGLIFQSTLPARGATSERLDAGLMEQLFQSTLPARGATGVEAAAMRAYSISIHAPRTGSDGAGRSAGTTSIRISIHAPRTGSDKNLCRDARTATIFQSTLPARGATFTTAELIDEVLISIHAPRTGSDGGGEGGLLVQGISIHAPRTGSDSAYL